LPDRASNNANSLAHSLTEFLMSVVTAIWAWNKHVSEELIQSAGWPAIGGWMI
jgi:hypothetical protein